MCEDTIFARASGAGRAGVAVFRISGPRALEAARGLTGKSLKRRVATRVDVVEPGGELIDAGLAIAFPAPASFTGEDVVEFHLHGSAAVESALYKALAGYGARPAEAGEFTRRAFENGKLDLAQVEALADLIEAQTQAQRRQALGQLDGRLSRIADGWRARLLQILAPLEADVDFPDEDDVPEAVARRAGPQIDALVCELERYRREAGAARAIREGVEVAILGAPNAGKSSLLNRLAGVEAAIVSDLPGTTRDVIELRLDLGGVPVVMADTAGLRDEIADDIESEGMARARARAEAADIRLLVVDPFAEGIAVSRETFELQRDGDILVLNKSDLGVADARRIGADSEITRLSVSAKTGEGVSELVAALGERVRDCAGVAGEAGLTRARHVAAVDAALASLRRAREMVASAPELAAEDVRLAARALGEITGAVGVEEVLGEIFSSFCIGK